MDYFFHGCVNCVLECNCLLPCGYKKIFLTVFTSLFKCTSAFHNSIQKLKKVSFKLVVNFYFQFPLLINELNIWHTSNLYSCESYSITFLQNPLTFLGIINWDDQWIHLKPGKSSCRKNVQLGVLKFRHYFSCLPQ